MEKVSLVKAGGATAESQAKPKYASLGDSGQMSNDHAGVIVLPPLTIVPPLLAGLLLHFLWTPLRFFPEWWIGLAVG